MGVAFSRRNGWVSLSLCGVAVWAALIASPPRVEAWSRDGHVIVARIAEQHLTPRARQAVKDLLGERPMSDSRIAGWADYIKHSAEYKRKYPKNDLWHFVDIPLEREYDPARDCKHDNCILARLSEFSRIAGDRRLSHEERKEALMFVIHFVGDLHQPLHCAERHGDRGGNLVHVSWLNEHDHHKLSLHGVWDGNLVEMCVGDLTPTDLADRLSSRITEREAETWVRGNAANWAQESHDLARQFVYKMGDGRTDMPPADAGIIHLDEKYAERNAPVVEIQLMRGGVRLASMLNRIFE